MDNIYYDLDKIDKKGKLFNFITTVRSTGKTISMKRRTVREALKGNRFVYIRRKAAELKSNEIKNFYQKMQSLGYYADKMLTYDKEAFWMDGEQIGYAVALSTGQNKRSMDFLKVTDIYFEEFCIKEDKNNQYLKDEVFTFLELYSTIARYDDVRVWFLGNKISEFNPYYLYFNILPPREPGLKTWKDFAIELWDDPRVQKRKRESRFGKIIEGTPYDSYAIETNAYETNYSFIRKLPTRSTLMFNIVFSGELYGIWHCQDMSIEIAHPGDTRLIYSISPKDLTPGTPHIKAIRDSGLYLVLRTAIRKNLVFYATTKTEEVGRQFIRECYFAR